MFYNTTSETEPELSDYRGKTTCQDAAIIRYFERLNGNPASPSQVWKALFSEKTPITSVRRSLTTLTEAGILEKTTWTTGGYFGRPEHLWRLQKLV